MNTSNFKSDFIHLFYSKRSEMNFLYKLYVVGSCYHNLMVLIYPLSHQIIYIRWKNL